MKTILMKSGNQIVESNLNLKFMSMNNLACMQYRYNGNRDPKQGKTKQDSYHQLINNLDNITLFNQSESINHSDRITSNPIQIQSHPCIAHKSNQPESQSNRITSIQINMHQTNTNQARTINQSIGPIQSNPIQRNTTQSHPIQPDPIPNNQVQPTQIE